MVKFKKFNQILLFIYERKNIFSNLIYIKYIIYIKYMN